MKCNRRQNKKTNPGNSPVLIMFCREADKEHAAALRQYAHTFHHPNTICVARAFAELPENIREGLVAHELGHLLLWDKPDHTEAEANKAIFDVCGALVKYRDTPHGKHLEFLASAL